MKNFSFIKNINYKKAFSLSENLTVLVVLGVIILLTVPHVVKDRTLKNDRIALRKAVNTYDSILKKEFILSTGINNTNDLAQKIIRNNCIEIITGLFNTQGNQGCQSITTIDGINWNLSVPQEAIITLKGGTSSEVNAQDPNNFKVFYITFDIDQNRRELRILSPSNNVNVQKTIDFVTND